MSEIVEIKVAPEKINSDGFIQQNLEESRVSKAPIKFQKLLRRSLDSRQKSIFYLLRFELFYDNETPTTLDKRKYKDVRSEDSVIIVGAGPAGYFAALELICKGLKPIVLERGKDVQQRRRDLRAIQQEGIVNPHSNYCFGEGGAGTYSDGKLYTRSHKRGNITGILETLFQHGAAEDILYDAHPHIGSNKLPKIVSNLRQTIEEHGGEVRFDTYVTDIILEDGVMKGVITSEGERLTSKATIFATGHSARDIFYLLHKRGITIESKDYAIGVRIEHPQAIIDDMQYRQNPRNENLPAASYRLATEVDNKGVFSFCMCPGGLIVPAATAPEELVVNGMSLSRRDSPFSNSGFVTAVDQSDFLPFTHTGVFAGLEFQKSIEQKMWKHGNGSQEAPAQRLTDFLDGKVSSSLNTTSYIPGIYSADMKEILPPQIHQRLKEGLKVFGKRYRKYITDQAQLIGIESRTSSPLRIPRSNDNGMHPQTSGFFPCGEGAGYAGGILSACMDGEYVARKVADFYGK